MNKTIKKMGFFSEEQALFKLATLNYPDNAILYPYTDSRGTIYIVELFEEV